MGFNPVRFVESVTSQFRRYQLTAFPIANPRLAAQARALLGELSLGLRGDRDWVVALEVLKKPDSSLPVRGG